MMEKLFFAGDGTGHANANGWIEGLLGGGVSIGKLVIAWAFSSYPVHQIIYIIMIPPLFPLSILPPFHPTSLSHPETSNPNLYRMPQEILTRPKRHDDEEKGYFLGPLEIWRVVEGDRFGRAGF